MMFERQISKTICGKTGKYIIFFAIFFLFYFGATLFFIERGKELFSPEAFSIDIHRSSVTFVFAGLLIGFGARLGNGCTSGHGVCGISRFSMRSIIATATFVIIGALAVYVVNHLLGSTL